MIQGPQSVRIGTLNNHIYLYPVTVDFTECAYSHCRGMTSLPLIPEKFLLCNLCYLTVWMLLNSLVVTLEPNTFGVNTTFYRVGLITSI